MQLTIDDMGGWEALRAKAKSLVWVYLFFGVVAVVALVAGVRELLGSRYVVAICLLSGAGAAVALLAMTSIVLVLRRRSVSRVKRGDTGSFVASASMGYATSSAFFYVLIAVSAGSATFGTATRRMDFVGSGRLGGVLAVLAPVLAILAATFVVSFVAGFLRFPRVECTAQTLSIGGYVARETVAWEDVVAIEAVIYRNSAGISLRVADDARVDLDVFRPRFLRHRKIRAVEIPVYIFATGALPLLLLLRFYLEHPESRDELDDGCAYERLRAVSP